MIDTCFVNSEVFMNRIGFLIVLFLLVFQFSVISALEPPLFTNRDEFKTLVNDKQFTSKLDSGDAIVAIYQTKTGFTVLTNKHKMYVDVVQDNTAKPGPAKFHLVFHDPVPRKHFGERLKAIKEHKEIKSTKTPTGTSK